jgi:hypothetical protein
MNEKKSLAISTFALRSKVRPTTNSVVIQRLQLAEPNEFWL